MMLLYLLIGLPLIKGDDVAAYVDTFPSHIPHCDMRGLPPSAISCIHLAPDGSLVHAKDLRSSGEVDGDRGGVFGGLRGPKWR